MKKQLVIIGIVAILVTVGLSGCNDVSDTSPGITTAGKDKFVGHWMEKSNSNNVVDFFSNGTCKFINNLISTWNLTNDRLTITFPNSTGADPQQFSYEFSNNYKTLTITNLIWNDTHILTK